MWQVTPRISDMEFLEEVYSS